MLTTWHTSSLDIAIPNLKGFVYATNDVFIASVTVWYPHLTIFGCSELDKFKPSLECITT